MAREKKYDPIPFDTLSYAKKLKAAGFTQEQAEIQAETFLSIVHEQLVSKRDLKELEKEMKRDSENIRKDLKTDIEMVKRDLKIWFGGMLVVAVGVISAVVAWVPHLSR